jgi:hypothetical protein
MVKIAAAIGLVCLAGLALAFPGTQVVQPELLTGFASSRTQSITVILKKDVMSVYEQIEANGKQYTVRGQKMTDIREALISHNAQTQKALRQLLDSKSISYKTFWISNRMIIKEATLELVNELKSYPDVAQIRKEVVAQLHPVESKPAKHQESPYGIGLVGAPDVWAAGNTGEGVIVSTIDTGVRGSHSILAANFRGEFGWFDPSYGSQTPNDEQGHGSHTMGTIAGQNGYGVAPGAKWQACMGCIPSGCYEEDLFACAEFTTCPHDPNGNNADCTKAPHLTSNSWGGGGGDSWFDEVIHNWHVAGIIPVFSAGNNGGSCNTLGSPGDRNVIGVAASDVNDEIAYFSSRGPGQWWFKPDIAAPGLDVLSAWYDGDNSFNTISGTSMACPHVSGGVALLLAAKPELIGDYDGVKEALFASTVKQGLTGSGQNCGGISDSVVPNHVFGNGRLDVLAATQSLRNVTRH